MHGTLIKTLTIFCHPDSMSWLNAFIKTVFLLQNVQIAATTEVWLTSDLRSDDLLSLEHCFILCKVVLDISQCRSLLHHLNDS